MGLMGFLDSLSHGTGRSWRTRLPHLLLAPVKKLEIRTGEAESLPILWHIEVKFSAVE